MKYWIINNTKFGYKNNNTDWYNVMLNYFNDSFIPYIEKYSKPEDTLIHLGNLFDSEHINTLILNSVQELFERISNILPIKLLVGSNDVHSGSKNNKINTMNIFKHFNNIQIISEKTKDNNILYIPWTKTLINELDDSNLMFINSDYINNNSDLIINKTKDKTIFCGYYNDYNTDNIIRIGAPYQFEKTSDKKGFCVYDSIKNKHMFIENNYSPKFKTIIITNEEQIKDLNVDDIKYNYVNVIVDKSLVNSNKIKLEVLLSKYEFKNITYINNDNILDDFENDTDIDIINICREHLKDSKLSVINEFENIVRIKNERY